MRGGVGGGGVGGGHNYIYVYIYMYIYIYIYLFFIRLFRCLFIRSPPGTCLSLNLGRRLESFFPIVDSRRLSSNQPAPKPL